MLTLTDASTGIELLSEIVQPSDDSAPISLTQPAYELALDLVKLGAREDAVELPLSVDRTPLVELRRKGAIRTVGGARGRPARIALLVDPTRLVQSQRKRSGATTQNTASRSTVVRNRPTVEDLRALIAAIDDIEAELRRTLKAEIEDDIVKLKTDLVAARNGSFRERELFEELKIAMDRSRTIADEIRSEALKRIETARGPLAQFVALLSRERSSL